VLRIRSRASLHAAGQFSKRVEHFRPVSLAMALLRLAPRTIRTLPLFAACLFVASQAQAIAQLVAGWDFSQSCLEGNLCDQAFQEVQTLPANYSDLDPTDGMGAESAAFGTMHLDGQFGSSDVPGFSGWFTTVSPSLTLNTSVHADFPSVAMGAEGNASIMQSEIPGVPYQQHAMRASDIVDAVFRVDLTSSPGMLGSDWEVSFAAQSEGAASEVAVSFSMDGVDYGVPEVLAIGEAEEVITVALGGTDVSEAFVKLSFDFPQDPARIDNLAIKAELQQMATTTTLAATTTTMAATTTTGVPTTTSVPTTTTTVATTTAIATTTLPPEPTLLSKDQQRCVNKLNKDGQAVDQTQLRENEMCLKDFQKGKLFGTVEDCLTADRQVKVQKANDRTVRDDIKLCMPLDPQPPFAYTGAATVNDAAVVGPIDLIHTIFGNPVDNAPLVTSEANKETARCQTVMLKQAGRLEDAVLNELNKAKKKSIKGPVVDSAEALEVALAAVLSSNEKITRQQDQLYKKVDESCETLQALPSTVFPGACADADLGLVENCVIDAARCVACLKMNAFDDLALDCDQWDNQAQDGSCLVPTP